MLVKAVLDRWRCNSSDRSGHRVLIPISTMASVNNYLYQKASSASKHIPNLQMRLYIYPSPSITQNDQGKAKLAELLSCIIITSFA